MAFSWYKTCTVDAAQCGGTDSTNFPVTVNITDADLKVVGSGGYVQNSNGYDIGFYSDITLTTKLDWEVELYVSTTGQLVAHVRIPTVSYTTNTVFYMAFGDAGISTFQGNVTGTWNSAFKGVWHFPDGTTLGVLDSTSNANNGTNNSSSAVAGIANGGAHNTGPTNGISTGITTAFTDFTVCMWFKTTTDGAFQRLIDKSYSGGFWMGQAGTGGDSYFGGGVLQNGAPYGIFVAVNFPTNTWHMLAMTRSGTTQTVIGDGSMSTSQSVSGSAVDSTAFGIAYLSGSGFTGDYDEVRLSNVARSADWILTEYNNQKSSSTFISFGSKTGTSSGATVNAVAATATAEGISPSIAAGATVTATLALSTAEVIPPSVTAGATVAAPIAIGLAEAIPPSVSAGATVPAPIAEAIAAAIPPSILAAAQVLAQIGNAIADFIVPTVSAGATVTSTIAQGTADFLPPQISTSGSANVFATPAEALAELLTPSVSAGASITSTLALAIAAGIPPTISAGATVQGVIGNAVAEFMSPVVTGDAVSGPAHFATVSIASPGASTQITNRGASASITAPGAASSIQ